MNRALAFSLVVFGCASEPAGPALDSPPVGPAGDPLKRHGSVDPASVMPAHLVPVVNEWRAVLQRNLNLWGVRWTEAGKIELDATRERAREVILAASPSDQGWLWVGYVKWFWLYDVGDWVDPILLAIPVEHLVWASADGAAVFRALEQSEQPEPLRAYIDALVEYHRTAWLRAGVAHLQLEEADRAGDWARAHELFDSLQRPDLRATFGQDASARLDPDRPLRAGTTLPHSCLPAIAGPDTGQTICLDAAPPSDTSTLIVGWTSRCEYCTANTLPRVAELVANRPVRVIVMAHDRDASRALEALDAIAVPPEWTILLLNGKLSEEQPRPDQTYMALVEPGGLVTAGPPWLDTDTLAAALPDVSSRYGAKPP